MAFSPFAEAVAVYECCLVRVIELFGKGLYELFIVFPEYGVLRERCLFIRVFGFCK